MPDRSSQRPPPAAERLDAHFYMRLSRRMLDDLRRIAAVEGRSVSDFVRRCLQDYIATAGRRQGRR
jgi:hypothetical protein